MKWKGFIMIKVEEKTSIKKQNRNDLAKHYTIKVMKNVMVMRQE